MNIQALQAGLSPWNPLSGSGTTSRTSSTAATSASSTVPGNTDSSTSTSGSALSGTSSGLLADLGPLELPSRESIDADRKAVGNDLRMAMNIAGIETSPAVSFEIDKSGQVKVDPSDPRAASIEAMLDRDSNLEYRLGKLVSDGQFIEHLDAATGWYAQVNNGVSANDATRSLLAAADAIDAATGFTLSDGEITLESDGMGARLMPTDVKPASDEEKMWEETLRLVGRRTDPDAAIAAETSDTEEKDNETDPTQPQPTIRSGG